MAISSIKVLESHFVKSCAKLAQAPQIQCAEIAILGRSNVGKSSLINALLNRKNLAKSSSTPGKTRLVNFFESKWRIALDCGNFNESTHPLAPSAREGEQNVNPTAREGGQSANPSARELGQNVKSGAISQKAEFTEIAKVFNVKDGLALAYWRKKLNRKVAIITGRSSEILKIRANELGIGDLLFMNVRDKGEVLRELKQRFALDLAQIAAVGDDLNDISMFNESHLNFAPNDCASAFKDGALKSLPNITILNAKGGCGAVREAIEMILQKEQIYEKFIQYWQ